METFSIKEELKGRRGIFNVKSAMNIRMKIGSMLFPLLLLGLLSCEEDVLKKQDIQIEISNWVKAKANDDTDSHQLTSMAGNSRFYSIPILDGQIDRDSIRNGMLVLGITENNLMRLGLDNFELENLYFEVWAGAKTDTVLFTKGKNVWNIGGGSGSNSHGQLESISMYMSLPVKFSPERKLHSDNYKHGESPYDTLSLSDSGDLLTIKYKSIYTGKEAEAKLIIK